MGADSRWIADIGDAADRPTGVIRTLAGQRRSQDHDGHPAPTDKNRLFARPQVMSTARVRENWF